MEINVDGEPLEPDEDEEEKRPSSRASRESKGTASKKSDFDEDEVLQRSTLLETGEGDEGALSRKSDSPSNQHSGDDKQCTTKVSFDLKAVEIEAE